MDADYIVPLSLMGGYDMGINFDGFGEQMKKFMELPGKYLDAVHDKTVGLIEGVSALIEDPFCALEIQLETPNGDSETLEDLPSENIITRTSPKSIQTETHTPNAEFSSPLTPVITAEDDLIAPAGEDISSKRDQIEVNDQCQLSEEPPITETCGNDTSVDSISVGETSGNEEASLCSSEDSVKPLPPGSVSCGANTNEELEPVRLYSSVSPGNRVENFKSETSTSGGVVLLAKISENEDEQTVLCNADNCVEAIEHGDDGPDICSNGMGQFVDDDLQNDQDDMKVSLGPQPKNTSLKRKIMRGLTSKFRWSKKDMNVHQGTSIGSQGAGSVSDGADLLPDDLESGWELL